MPPVVSTVLLLVASNTFMTVAWYGHLKHADRAFWVRILVSWLIALPEYALQVPANAIGVKVVSPTVLKVIQEVVSLAVFVGFAWWYFGEAPTWRTMAAFALIAAAVALVVTGRPPVGTPPEARADRPTAAAASPATPPVPAACPPGVGPRPRPTCPSSGA